MDTTTTKVCAKCAAEKPLSEFYRTGWCKPCTNTYARAWQAANPEKAKASLRRGRLMRRYGLTEAAFNEMFAAQAGCCAICKRHQSEVKGRLQVDHDHRTGMNRDLLCTGCNTALGRVNDSVDILEAAIDYLIRFEGRG
jgi:hypothetical protein